MMQLVTTVVIHARFLLDLLRENLFFAVIVLNSKKVVLSSGILEVETLNDQKKDKCLALFVLTVVMSVKFHLDQLVIDLYIAVIVLGRRRMPEETVGVR